MALILLGLGVYLTIWYDPSIGPYPDTPGQWRTAPDWVRRLVRRGQGPVLIAAVAVQVAAAVTAAFGILRQLGMLEYPLSGYGAWLVVLSWGGALGVWGLLAIRARGR